MVSLPHLVTLTSLFATFSSEWLLANGADWKALDSSGRTPEQLAQEYGHDEVSFKTDCAIFWARDLSVERAP